MGPHIAKQLGLTLTELNDDSMQKIVNIIGLAIVAGKTINATASGAANKIPGRPRLELWSYL